MPRLQDPDTTRTGDRSRVLIVMAIAFLARLIYLIQSSNSPYFSTPTFDGQNFDLLARGILKQGLKDPQLFWQPVFYPCFLVVNYALGGTVLTVKILQIVIGTVTCGLTCQIGRQIFNPRVAWIAGLATALYGPLIFLDAELVANVWGAFWCIAMVWLMLRLAQGTQSPWLWVCWGITGGLATLTRSTLLLSFVAGLIWLIWKRAGINKDFASISKLAVVAIAGFALPTIPVATQCYWLTGRASIMAANGGMNLYVGNNENAPETEAIPPSWEFVQLRKRAHEAGYTGIWGEDRYFAGLAKQYFKQHPMAAAVNFVRKTGQYLCSREIPGYEDVYLQRRWSSLLSLLVWKVGPFGFPYGVLLPLSILGAMVAARRIPAPLWIMLIIEVAAVIFFHVIGRYRMTITPLLAILAGAGVSWLIDSIQARQRIPLCVAAGFLVAMIPLVSWPGPYKLEAFDTESELALSAGYYEQTQNRNAQKAIAHYTHALSVRPDFPPAYFNRAATYREKGMIPEAVEDYRQTIRLAPEHSDSYYNLGNALAAAGRSAEAIDALEQAVKLDPALSQAHYNLGYLLTDAGKTREAIQHYQLATQFAPGLTEAWVNLGMLLEQNGDIAGAAAAYQSALRVNPGLGIAERRLKALSTRPTS